MIPQCLAKSGVSPTVRIPVPLRVCRMDRTRPFSEEFTKIIWYWLILFKFLTLETSKSLVWVVFPFRFIREMSIGPVPRIPTRSGELSVSNIAGGQSINCVKLWTNAALTSYSIEAAWADSTAKTGLAIGAHQPPRNNPTTVKYHNSLFFKIHLNEKRSYKTTFVLKTLKSIFQKPNALPNYGRWFEFDQRPTPDGCYPAGSGQRH